MSLHRTCCCGPGDPICCECDLASSYALSVSIGGTALNSCFNNTTIAITNGTTVLGQGGDCVFCDPDSSLDPPGTFARSHWGNVLSSSNWTGLGLGSTTCPPPSNYDCSVGGTTNEPGTTIGLAKSNRQCFGGLTCVNEIDQTTGASYYYWSLGLQFESTATSGLSGGRPTQRWYMGFRAFSELRTFCHPPTSAVWPVTHASPPSGFDLPAYNGLANSAYLAYHTGTNFSWTFPATCYVGSDYAFGSSLFTCTSLVVSIS